MALPVSNIMCCWWQVSKWLYYIGGLILATDNCSTHTNLSHCHSTTVNTKQTYLVMNPGLCTDRLLPDFLSFFIFCVSINLMCGPGSSVGIVTACGLDGPYRTDSSEWMHHNCNCGTSATQFTLFSTRAVAVPTEVPESTSWRSFASTPLTYLCFQMRECARTPAIPV